MYVTDYILIYLVLLLFKCVVVANFVTKSSQLSCLVTYLKFGRTIFKVVVFQSILTK